MTAQPEPRVATTFCDHAYGVRILGGHPISVRLCTLCHTPDWNDLHQQARTIYQWGREEALAGRGPRDFLTACDMPQEQP